MFRGLVIDVMHRDEPKMVGKTLRLTTSPDGSRCEPYFGFLHADVRGSQAHRTTECPGGLDICVLDWLLAEGGYLEYHHWLMPSKPGDVPRPGVLYVAPLTVMQAKGIAQTSDGRHRVYLPTEYWDVHPAPWYAIPHWHERLRPVLLPKLPPRGQPVAARGNSVLDPVRAVRPVSPVRARQAKLAW